MYGGAGNDSFVFDQTPSAANADFIRDFSVPGDTIRLDHAVFDTLAIGKLSAANFGSWSGTATADTHVLYDKATGHLYYDATGGAHDDAQLVATLSNMPQTLSADDVFVF
jgi:Ca2+-binding RTX toxin-like protein